MERVWKLGDDLGRTDSILDGVTFDDLILAVHHNCQQITPGAVEQEMKQILEQRLEDANYLVEKNIQEIIEEAMKGRG